MDGKSGEVGSRYEHAGTTWKRRAVIPAQAGIHEGEGKQVEMSEMMHDLEGGFLGTST